jgi:OHCU decarboxylase
MDFAMSIPRIEQLNNLPSSQFFEAVNTLFETAPPLCEALLKHKPYTCYKHLIDTAQKCISLMPLAEKVWVAYKDYSNQCTS